MIVEKNWLWKDSGDNLSHSLPVECKEVTYTRYCVDNTVEIEANRTYPAIIVCGGGGYLRNTEREKDSVALYFLNEGYQVFVLDYRTKCSGNANYPGPVYDLAEMMYQIRCRAKEWRIDKAAVMGFSAGGHLCACLETQWNAPFLQERYKEQTCLLKPDAAVLCYPLVDYLYQMDEFSQDPDKNSFILSKGMKKGDYLQVTCEAGVGIRADKEKYRQASPLYYVNDETPPTFLWHTLEDELIYAGQTLEYAKRLGECAVPYELHIFEKGPHGLVLADERTAGNDDLICPDVAEWTKLCVSFLKRHLKTGD